ncbi:MAG: DUF456 domain-containing protein [Ornithinimicrobium sp.]
MIVAVTTILMVVGLFGIVIPILPGLLFVWSGVLVWAIAEGSTLGWLVLMAATAIALAGAALQFLLPGQRMRNAGVATSTLLVAVAVGVVLGIAVPVVGFFVGFPLGIYVVQRVRRGGHVEARRSTGLALKAIGMNILIELSTALLVITLWVSTVLWWS